MLLLGVVQAQAFEAAGAGSYDLLQTEILTGTQASVTFSSLGDYAADYQHLQVRFTARTTSTGRTTISMRSRLNADTGSNYRGHGLGGNGSSVFSFDTTASTSALSGIIGTADLAADIFGSGVIDLLDPFNSSKNSTFKTLSGVTSGNRVDLHSGVWFDNDSVTSWTILPESDSFVAECRFSLYGLKASV